jgi:hypothetical protein
MLRFARNDDCETEIRIPATRCVRVMREPTSLEEKRVQGRPGAGRTRSLVCSKKAHELVTTGSTETSGLPRAVVLTLIFVVSVTS